MASSEKNITSGYNIKDGKVTKKDLHIVETLETKVDKVEGKQLSDENYTLAEKNKLESTEVFTSEEKIKLSNIQTPMQIAGSVASVDDLPTENVKKVTFI